MCVTAGLVRVVVRCVGCSDEWLPFRGPRRGPRGGAARRGPARRGPARRRARGQEGSEQDRQDIPSPSRTRATHAGALLISKLKVQFLAVHLKGNQQLGSPASPVQCLTCKRNKTCVSCCLCCVTNVFAQQQCTFKLKDTVSLSHMQLTTSIIPA